MLAGRCAAFGASRVERYRQKYAVNMIAVAGPRGDDLACAPRAKLRHDARTQKLAPPVTRVALVIAVSIGKPWGLPSSRLQQGEKPRSNFRTMSRNCVPLKSRIGLAGFI